MSMKKDDLLMLIRTGKPMTTRQQLHLTALLSMPAIMAQISSIIMQYIDASMVGSLGAEPAASIGLVSTSTWLFGGLPSAAAVGFYVQVAHRIGADDMEGAKHVLRQSLLACLLWVLMVTAIGVSISGGLPVWLGGNPDITADASTYFLIFSLALPAFQMNSLAGGMLRCSGNILIPSLLNVLLCVLDVVFNFFLIFPTREVSLLGLSMTVPGAGLGVKGAALGTCIAVYIIGLLMMYFMWFRSKELKLIGTHGSFMPTLETLKRAVTIGLPMGIEHVVMCGAQIMTTIIVAPLLNVAQSVKRINLTGLKTVFVAFRQSTTSHAVNSPFTLKNLIGIKSLKGHPIRMKRKKDVRLPIYLCWSLRLKDIKYSHISLVSLSRCSQRAIECNLVRGCIRILFSKDDSCFLRSHSVTA